MEAGTTSPWGGWGYPDARYSDYAPEPAIVRAPPARTRANPEVARNRRVLAAGADLFVLALAVLAMGATMNDDTGFTLVAWLITAVSVSFIYYFVQEAVFGQTLGKALFDIRVVTWRQEQPSIGQIFWRTAMRVVDQLPLGLIGALSITLTGKKRRQRLGDRLAMTYVVRASQTPAGRGPEGAIAVVGIMLALIPVALVHAPTRDGLLVPNEAYRTQRVANEYLTAAIHGDTATACRLMSQGEKRAIVARGLHTYVGAASDADCQRFAGRYLKRDAHKYAMAGGPPVDLGKYGRSVLALAGASSVVGMTADGDDWKVDQVAGAKAGFVKGCQTAIAGAMKHDPCGCIFDELRGRGYESDKQIVALMKNVLAGGEPTDLVVSIQACVPQA